MASAYPYPEEFLVLDAFNKNINRSVKKIVKYIDSIESLNGKNLTNKTRSSYNRAIGDIDKVTLFLRVEIDKVYFKLLPHNNNNVLKTLRDDLFRTEGNISNKLKLHSSNGNPLDEDFYSIKSDAMNYIDELREISEKAREELRTHVYNI